MKCDYEGERGRSRPKKKKRKKILYVELLFRAYHESKLAHAMAVFEMHARGPLFEEFSEKLQAECDKHWRTGRQMCEVLSLTGNPCTNPIHKGGSEGAGGGEQLEPGGDNR